MYVCVWRGSKGFLLKWKMTGILLLCYTDVDVAQFGLGHHYPIT